MNFSHVNDSNERILYHVQHLYQEAEKDIFFESNKRTEGIIFTLESFGLRRDRRNFE
jgi:hypothetical protein